MTRVRCNNSLRLRRRAAPSPPTVARLPSEALRLAQTYRNHVVKIAQRHIQVGFRSINQPHRGAPSVIGASCDSLQPRVKLREKAVKFASYGSKLGRIST